MPDFKTTKELVPDHGCRKSLNVECAAREVECATDDMSDAMGDLNAVLEPLLGPERPVGCTADRQAGASQVADHLLSQAGRIRAFAERIRDLIERL